MSSTISFSGVSENGIDMPRKKMAISWPFQQGNHQTGLVIPALLRLSHIEVRRPHAKSMERFNDLHLAADFQHLTGRVGRKIKP